MPASSGGTVGASGNQNIDALLSDYRWVGAIAYSFPDARNDYEADYREADASGFGSVSSAQMQAARYILEGASASSTGPRMGLTAVEQFTTASISDAGFGNADIRIAQSSLANPTAYAYYPVGDYRAGDVWFGTQTNYRSPAVGNYAYHTMLHELGHALGLKHGHELGGPANTAMTYDRDSMEFSVMTYRSYVGASLNGYRNETFGYAQTFMMYDLAALQHMYGANFNTNSGSTVYRWDPSTGETFVNGVGQGRPGANRVFLTLWDGGGEDTYDFSNYTTNLSVDLTPGGWSLLSDIQRANLGDGNYARGNVFNALQYRGDSRSLVENAIGGSGSDRITGNAARNILEGRGGNDILDGGADYDTAVFSGPRSQYVITLLSSGSVRVQDLRGGSPDGTDEVRNIEAFRFSDDTFTFSQSVGGQNPDIIGTELGDDLYATSSAERIYGLAGNDRLWGFEGDDQLIGGAGADVLTGGPGQDEASYHNSDNGVRVVLFQNTGRYGDAEGDLFGSIEDIIGSQYADEIFGDNANNRLYGLGGHDNLEGCAGNDQLDGGDGNDKLYGQDGSDVLIGRAGQDRLFGGADADTFVFAAISDSIVGAPDEVVEFTREHGDKIDLSGIDANTNISGNQAFTFVGSQALTNNAGELRYTGRILEGDVDGDGRADFAIQFNLGELRSSDFIL